MKICILGEGAFGSALSLILSDNGHAVNLWCHHEAIAQEINSKRTNSGYFKDIVYPESITATPDIAVALDGVELICVAIPVPYISAVLKSAKKHIKQHHIIVSCSKGIDQDTLLLPSQIIISIYPDNPIAVLSGPSFASEIAQKQKTAVDLGSLNKEILRIVQHVFDNTYFKTNETDDIIGMQVGGALKNCVAIAMGIVTGARYGQNTQALVFTQGLHEMAQISTLLGGKQETLYGLSGIGDLLLTATSEQSKNFKLGHLLGSGLKLEQALSHFPTAPEGLNTLQSVAALCHKHHIPLPLFNTLDQLINREVDVSCFINAL